jgi:hypothetical protein
MRANLGQTPQAIVLISIFDFQLEAPADFDRFQKRNLPTQGQDLPGESGKNGPVGKDSHTLF